MSVIGGATKYNATMQALFAVVELGGKFYDVLGLDFEDEDGDKVTLYEKTREYAASIRDAVVRTRKEAIESEAWFVEEADMGGYRLCRFHKGGGESYSGEVFRTWDLFWRAMRTVEDVARRNRESREAAARTQKEARKKARKAS
jgi:hypothetical protein